MKSEPDITHSALPAHLEARVEAIIRAAEDHAQSIHRDLESQQRAAESEARGRVLAARREAGDLTEDRLRRLRELTDELTERAEATLSEFQAFAEALERATAELARGGLAATGGDPAAEPDPGAAAREGDSEAARLVALEMAVDGLSRAEVSERLREQFAIPGLEALLDDVYGARGPRPRRRRDG
jgi:hypothetical protein